MTTINLDDLKKIVVDKQKFIGGVLEDNGDEVDRGIYKWFNNKDMPCDQTTIIDIILRPTGINSFFFEIIGEHFKCGFDVNHGQIVAGKYDHTTFVGFGGHVFSIQPWKPVFTVGDYVHYIGHGDPENGRVKALHPLRKDAVWVVYKCADQWEFFMNYTGQLTEIKDLERGWASKSPK